LFATHPPLEQRILRLDPRWDGQYIAAAAQPKPAQVQPKEAPGIPGAAAAGLGIIASIGNPSVENIVVARQQLDSLPPALAGAAHNTLGSCLLMHCLIIVTSDQQFAAGQLDYLRQQLNATSFRMLETLLQQVGSLPRQHYLLLTDLALPALAQLSQDQYRIFMRDLQQLIQADARVSLFEWCLYRILRYSLDRKRRGLHKQVDLDAAVADCQLLMSAMAKAGQDSKADARAAYQAGMASLELPTTPDLLWKEAEDLGALDKAVNRLLHLKPLQKPRLLKALVICIQHDGVIAGAEGELLRAVGAVIDCPIPPLH
jgi:HAMP domain-containing protein